MFLTPPQKKKLNFQRPSKTIGTTDSIYDIKVMFYDVLLCFTLFYLYTLTFAVLNCLLVLIVEFKGPQRQMFHFTHLL